MKMLNNLSYTTYQLQLIEEKSNYLNYTTGLISAICLKINYETLD